LIKIPFSRIETKRELGSTNSLERRSNKTYHHRNSISQNVPSQTLSIYKILCLWKLSVLVVNKRKVNRMLYWCIE